MQNAERGERWKIWGSVWLLSFSSQAVSPLGPGIARTPSPCSRATTTFSSPVTSATSPTKLLEEQLRASQLNRQDLRNGIDTFVKRQGGIQGLEQLVAKASPEQLAALDADLQTSLDRSVHAPKAAAPTFGGKAPQATLGEFEKQLTAWRENPQRLRWQKVGTACQIGGAATACVGLATLPLHLGVLVAGGAAAFVGGSLVRWFSKYAVPSQTRHFLTQALRDKPLVLEQIYAHDRLHGLRPRYWQFLNDSDRIARIENRDLRSEEPAPAKRSQVAKEIYKQSLYTELQRAQREKLPVAFVLHDPAFLTGKFSEHDPSKRSGSFSGPNVSIDKDGIEPGYSHLSGSLKADTPRIDIAPDGGFQRVQSGGIGYLHEGLIFDARPDGYRLLYSDDGMPFISIQGTRKLWSNPVALTRLHTYVEGSEHGLEAIQAGPPKKTWLDRALNRDPTDKKIR
jgi:hypothetical protein